MDNAELHQDAARSRWQMHFFSEKLRHDIQMHSGSETAPDRRWCRDAQGTPAGAQTDRGAPTTTEMSVPR